MVWGWQVSASSNVRRSSVALNDSIMCIASATAVASSSSDAFATGKAVKSQTTVWKLSSDSRRRKTRGRVARQQEADGEKRPRHKVGALHEDLLPAGGG